MKILQLSSGIFLVFIALMKFKVVTFGIDEGLVQYLFNASLMLTAFSVIFPLVSSIKLKMADVKDEERLTKILNEIDPESETEVFVSEKFMKNSAGALYRKSSLVIVCGKSLLNSLNDKQLKFLLAHEYFHIKKNHLLKNVFSFVFVLSGVPIALLIATPFFIPKIPIAPVLIFSFLTYVVSFVLHFILSQRREFNADKFASSIVGSSTAKEVLIILKEKNLIKEKSYNLFETHPSIKKRIEKLAT
ncbi:M48 family metallopeptidase [Pontibacillus salipaludis]|uniref:Protease HtpX n=1 Tax=Pontibacillus salipaludis TaxID=1697394 RepID=A0ABQ1QJA2_9BACI|nr:M48 family metalloprotease [Pontibacillus salipaludis]GGD29033.1 protease HtpX [Pontibacillus salipaludis]